MPRKTAIGEACIFLSIFAFNIKHSASAIAEPSILKKQKTSFVGKRFLSPKFTTKNIIYHFQLIYRDIPTTLLRLYIPPEDPCLPELKSAQSVDIIYQTCSMVAQEKGLLRTRPGDQLCGRNWRSLCSLEIGAVIIFVVHL
jgi:hypothetical protein